MLIRLYPCHFWRREKTEVFVEDLPGFIFPMPKKTSLKSSQYLTFIWETHRGKNTEGGRNAYSRFSSLSTSASLSFFSFLWLKSHNSQDPLPLSPWRQIASTDVQFHLWKFWVNWCLDSTIFKVPYGILICIQGWKSLPEKRSQALDRPATCPVPRPDNRQHYLERFRNRKKRYRFYRLLWYLLVQNFSRWCQAFLNVL